MQIPLPLHPSTPNSSSNTDIVSQRAVSYSQYSLWSNCPHQWKLRYVDGHKDSSGIELVFGKAMHDTVQHWLTLVYNDYSKSKWFDLHEHLKERIKIHASTELIDSNLTTPQELAEYYFDGCNILDHFKQYCKEWFPKTYQLIGVEVPLEINLPNVPITFRGYIDIVLYHKASKTYYIYDFKTSRAGWTYQKKDVKKVDQLLLYKKFYSKHFGIPEDNIKVEFIILKRKIPKNTPYLVKHISGFEPAHGKVNMKRAMERFNGFLSEVFTDTGQIKTDNLKPTPSKTTCRYCPFNNDKELCEVGIS